MDDEEYRIIEDEEEDDCTGYAVIVTIDLKGLIHGKKTDNDL